MYDKSYIAYSYMNKKSRYCLDMRIRALILKSKGILPKISLSTLFTKALEYYCYFSINQRLNRTIEHCAAQYSHLFAVGILFARSGAYTPEIHSQAVSLADLIFHNFVSQSYNV